MTYAHLRGQCQKILENLVMLILRRDYKPDDPDHGGKIQTPYLRSQSRMVLSRDPERKVSSVGFMLRVTTR